MGKRNITLTFALCTSLMVHGGLLICAIWWYIHLFSSPDLQALPVPGRAEPLALETRPPAPPPEDPIYQPKDEIRDDSGETDGTGTANRSTPGEKPMLARQAMSRQPDTEQSKKSEQD